MNLTAIYACENIVLNKEPDIISIISIVISALALLIAAIIGVCEIIQGQRDRKTALEAEYFRKIYGDHLLKIIPTTRRELVFIENGSLAGYTSFLDELAELRRDSAYFQYQDDKFYKLLKNKIQELEDFVTNALNRKIVSEDQTEFYLSINLKLQEVYRVISKRYFGN
ncbi:MAG: hypothetical protein VB034_09170 [Eubacteriales bacterium]|nr:hypothetical protein [Eubacteriales bacterium]